MTDRGTLKTPIFLPIVMSFADEIRVLKDVDHAHRNGRCVKNRWTGPAACTYRRPDLSSPEAVEEWLADG